MAVWVVQRCHVGETELEVAEAALRCFRTGAVKHACRQIDADYNTLRPDNFGRWQCRGSRPATNVEHFRASL